MQIKCNTSIMELEDTPLDIGYASEKVTLKDATGKAFSLGGQNGKTQVIITAPLIDDAFLEELKLLNKELPSGGDYEVNAMLVVANETHTNPDLEKFQFLIDSDEEFGDWYGVRLTGEPYGGEFAKAAFIISKDGALFYDEFVDDVHKAFNADTLLRKVAAAQTCYTGKGCH